MIIFENPSILYGIAPAVIILLFIIWRSFVGKKSNKKKKGLFLFSRVLIVSLLIISLANPYSFEKSLVDAEPRVKLLIDNSTSMQLFDYDIDGLAVALREKVPVIKKIIASDDSSRLGDAILSNSERNGNILLYTDGQITDGETIEGLFSLISGLNVTINAINIDTEESDASIAIFGPSETVLGASNNFLVSLEKTHKGDVPLKVSIDSEVVFNSRTSESVQLPGQRFLTEGWHTIKAEITDPGYFPNNNVFYKTVKVIERPKLLYMTKKDAPFKSIITSLYDVDEVTEIPNDLSQYYAVIVNDIKAKDLQNLDSLKEFLIDDNGLLVLGGFNSFEYGDYKNSPFLELLPVEIGTGDVERGGINVVMLIDISGSTGTTLGGMTKVDVEKALAISVLETLGLNNNVGALAFNDKARLIEDVNTLVYNKQSLRDKISSLKFSGGTYMNVGLAAAYQMLKDRVGSKYIIVLSDGKTQNSLQTLNLASLMSSQGVKVISVGVGQDTDAKFMTDLAREGKGFYLQADSTDRLEILFGDISESDGSRFSLQTVDDNHFITNNMILTAVLNAFNQVVPKDAADLIISTDRGRPALTVWRFGLGRVSSLNVFSASNTLGMLLDAENSQLLSRTVNWVIGNPERKKDFYVKIKDSRVDGYVDILVKSPNPPDSEISFVKFEDEKYIARIDAGNPGFHDALGGIYAVSYNKEYENIGLNDKLEALVESTGGKMFDISDVDGIVEFVKEKSKRLDTVKQSLLLYFLIPALIIFLIEVSIRRWFEVRAL